MRTLNAALIIVLGLLSGSAKAVAQSDARLEPERVRLRFSGILGQSQPAGHPPLPFVGSTGLVIDEQNHMWTASGNRLYPLEQLGGRWLSRTTIELPTSINTRLTLYDDGRDFYFLGSDWAVYCFDLELRQCRRVFGLSRKVRSFAVAPTACTAGHAARAKFFALYENGVEGYSADGEAIGTVVSLNRPDKAPWRYCSLGMEPATGNLLVGTTYPDMTVRMYDSQGRAIARNGWPRKRHSRHLLTVGGQAWSLHSGATSLPLKQTRADEAASAHHPWAIYTTGFTVDRQGDYWVASTQGIVRCAGVGKRTGLRLGGMSGVTSLAVSGDGTIVAAIEGGQRFVRLLIDDRPNAALLSNGNEPFRVGKGWKGRATNAVWDGKLFLVLDQTNRQLWGFDPWHTGHYGKPWIELTAPGSFVKPRQVAYGDGMAWVLDGERLLEAPITDLKPFAEIRLDGIPAGVPITHIHGAGSENLLIVAMTDSLRAYRRSVRGGYHCAWVKHDGSEQITAIAATAEHTVVLDNSSQLMTLISTDTGNVLGSLSYDSVAGGLAPQCVAIRGKWVFVADNKGKRLVRLKVERRTR